MSMLAPRLPGARVLDLFAGSGALGLEALSRGAAQAVFVERSRPALKVLRENIRSLEVGERARIRSQDVFAFLEGLSPLAFDLALADPPYEQGHAARLLERFRREPFARELWVEHGTREALPDLPGLRQRRYGDTTLTHLEASP
jgi:16S rRNA (guanine966-N2)-methyltransferase